MASCKKEDDHSILKSDILIRGISAKLDPPPVVYIETKKKWQISSTVFIQSTKDKCISVVLEKKLMESGRSINDLFIKYINLLSLKAVQVRSLNLGISRDPKPDEPAHANIFDSLDRTRSKFKKEVQKKLAEAAEVIPSP